MSPTLNSLLAQQRALDHETTYATVTMTLLSPHRAAVHSAKPARHGFLAGLAAGWRAFRHATAWVLTALGAALPFLIVVIVLAGIGYAGRRRIVRLIRRGPGPTASRLTAGQRAGAVRLIAPTLCAPARSAWPAHPDRSAAARHARG